jgi:hemerythrin-like domain-containing protein
VKRAEALRPLSREHQGALAVAKTLSEGEDAAAASRAFLEFWERDGRRHFRIEEEVLLPAWALAAEVDRPGVERMLAEHLEIRREALRLAAGGATVARVNALGRLLHDHVRFEERELFPLAEAALGAADLERLGAAIERAERE